MQHELENDLGDFEGFNFKTQSAIWPNNTAQEVVDWDHDGKGEAEFWPDGGNEFVNLLADGNCTASDIIEIDRIFSELDENEAELIKAVYLKQNNGMKLEDITREAVDDACLYVYGPGYFSELKKEAAWDLFEQLYPEAYKLCESWSVPGLTFDENDFLANFSPAEINTHNHQGYLVIDTL